MHLNIHTACYIVFISLYQYLLTTAIDQPPTEPSESAQERGGPPEETTTASAEVPVVPPRPFLPPRPFPPGKQSQVKGKGTRKKTTKHSNIQSVEKTHIRPQSHKEKVSSASEPKTDEPADVSNDNQEMEKEALTSEQPAVSNNKDTVEPLRNTDDIPSQSAPAQEQSQAPKPEEPSDTLKQPASPVNGISDAKEDISKTFDEEADQVRFH